MNSDTLHITKKSQRSHKNHDKHHKFPNGYIEDWSLTSPSTIKKKHNSIRKLDCNRKNFNNTKSSEKSNKGFIPVSIILSINNNQLLNKDNSYNIRFNTGMLEGSGITISETGNIITFQDEGSYRFEISGEASLFSDVDVKLVYFNNKFPDDIKPFSETIIPKNEGNLQLRGIPTILPLQKGQTIMAKLIPTPDESIILLAGTRLIIHRVA